VCLTAPSVIVCGVGPVAESSFLGATETFREFREVVARCASQRRTRYVDLFSFLARDDDLLLLDKFHPNARGHRRIADALLPAIRAAIREQLPAVAR
jgi:lysophospholipase L1-like esterase